MTTPTAVTGLPRPRVVLVGPPGAGKSTIGRRLSHALSCELVDSDHLIEQAKDKPCGEVFSELGEPDFRALEAEHVAAALRTGGVVSLGGGAVLTDSTRELLERHTVIECGKEGGGGIAYVVAHAAARIRKPSVVRATLPTSQCPSRHSMVTPGAS
jgi:predicted kinase